MAKDPRENRVPIMMSEAELALVDDWRFTNRIATRSDAIRRLCRLALTLAQEGTAIRKGIDQLREAVLQSDEVFAELVDAMQEDKAKKLASALVGIGRVASELEDSALNVFVPLELLRRVDATDTAIAQASSVVSEMKASNAMIADVDKR